MAVRCPKCSNVFTPAPGQPTRCPKCGFGAGGPARPAAPAMGGPAPGGYAPPYGQPPMMHGPPPKGQAVTSMVLGIVSCCIWIVPFIGIWVALASGITAIVMAVLAMKKIKLGQAAGRGMAITGLVLGIITTAVAALLLILMLFAVSILENLCKDQPSNPACKDYADDTATPVRTAAVGLLLAVPSRATWRLATKLA